MNKLSLVAAIVFAAAMMAPAAQAADGTIEFYGAVTGVTCKINQGARDMTVVLPTVSTDTLKHAGAQAGRTPFVIELTDCDAGAGTVSTVFEGDSHIDANGNLNIDAGGAANVQVSLLDENHKKIKVGFSKKDQDSQQVSVVGGSALLNYYAQYEATDAAGEGAVVTRVRYSISYE